jgi:phosphate acyltransferase
MSRDPAIKIAVDAMGGDRAPGVIVDGVVAAAREMDGRIILVGDEHSLERELSGRNASRRSIEIRHCTQVVGMNDAPVDAVRRKKDSSIRVAFEMVKQGLADAVVSAGNSGATLTAGTIILGRLPGVERPGIAGIFPTLKGRAIVMDIGANVDCKPMYLYQFAVMASVYAEVVLQVNSPKVGLLSIGEEDSKGNELVLKAHELLRSGLPEFIGNVEGRDVFTGVADVIVCDGFVGNVVLKLAEGLADVIEVMLKQELDAGWVSRLGTLPALGAFRRFKKKVDYAELGGAPLLGIKGVGIISHGASSSKAIKNAIRAASELAAADLPTRLTHRLNQFVPAAVS